MNEADRLVAVIPDGEVTACIHWAIDNWGMLYDQYVANPESIYDLWCESKLLELPEGL